MVQSALDSTVFPEACMNEVLQRGEWQSSFASAQASSLPNSSPSVVQKKQDTNVIRSNCFLNRTSTHHENTDSLRWNHPCYTLYQTVRTRNHPLPHLTQIDTPPPSSATVPHTTPRPLCVASKQKCSWIQEAFST